LSTHNAIEVEVHTSLRNLLRKQGNRGWLHHLTMARLVARALRLGSPALIQTENSVERYCLSYLMPALMGNWSIVIVAPETVQQRIIEQEIPLLQDWLGIKKSVRVGSQWQPEDRLLLTTPETWLSDRLNGRQNFPYRLPTIIDRADDLEEWTRQQLTITLEITDWYELLDYNQDNQELADLIYNARIQLTKSIFAHPLNRYECYSLEESEIKILVKLCTKITDQGKLTAKFQHFLPLLKEYIQNRNPELRYKHLIWVKRDRFLGNFTIFLAPVEVATALKTIWLQQPVVLIGSFLDRESQASIYREKLGLPEILTVKFAPNQQDDFIRLFIPDRFPLANTPEYSPALKEKIATLIGFNQNMGKSAAILVEDVPLRGQIASILAAKYGTKVKVNNTQLTEDGILVCGWQFWKQHQDTMSTPQLLIMTALPLPSLEHPIVASRVAYYRQRRQDWFRLYLLPTALKMIQQAIIPLRESQGIVVLLDSRVNFRSYGKTILSVLEPCARFNYIDPTWFFN
jgi:ATP-dependent DNA helicase DinG